MAKLGLDGVLEMLKYLNSIERETLLKNLSTLDKSLVEKIRAQLVTFEDLKYSNKNGLIELIKSVPRQILLLALRKSSDEFKEAIQKCLTQRAAALLFDELNQMNPQPLSKVLEAQIEVIKIAHKLIEEGKLLIKNKGDTDPLV